MGHKINPLTMDAETWDFGSDTPVNFVANKIKFELFTPKQYILNKILTCQSKKATQHKSKLYHNNAHSSNFFKKLHPCS